MTSTFAPEPRDENPESPLLGEHLERGAVLTLFAGWRMPLRFGSDLAEHRAVRTTGGLFDLSHMAQIEVTGPGAAESLDVAFVSVVSRLAPGRARYTVMTDEDGGVVDDVIVYRLAPDDFLVIANAGNRLAVLDALTQRARPRTAVVDRTVHRALIALQGPRSEDVLSGLTGADLSGLRYYGVLGGDVAGVPAIVARTGYTGEDGFEIGVPAWAARTVWRAIAEAGAPLGVVPCGLASRDTLRLEAGMPLYGHELTKSITPYDAGLARLVDLDHEFVGRAALARRSSEPAGVSLVGLRGEGRRAARAGCEVTRDGAPVGVVTSGALSPTLGYPIALALVDRACAGVGTEVTVDVRGTGQAMHVVPLPFYRRPR